MVSAAARVAFRRVHKYVTAIRAFHTGLISETHRHLHAIRGLERDIDVLRHPTCEPREKLAAVHRATRQLQSVDELKQPWRDTLRDLKRSLRRAEALLRKIVEGDRRRLGS